MRGHHGVAIRLALHFATTSFGGNVFSRYPPHCPKQAVLPEPARYPSTSLIAQPPENQIKTRHQRSGKSTMKKKQTRISIKGANRLWNLRTALDRDDKERGLIVSADGGFTNGTVLNTLPPPELLSSAEYERMRSSTRCQKTNSAGEDAYVRMVSVCRLPKKYGKTNQPLVRQ